MNPKKNLKKILEEEKLMFFLGAGVSMDFPAGLPNWKGLRDQPNSLLTEKLGIPQYNHKMLMHNDIINEDFKNFVEYFNTNLPNLVRKRLTEIETASVGDLINENARCLPPELVMSKIDRETSNFFSAIAPAFNAGEPNVNHKRIGKLVEKYNLLWIATSNWDRYIERQLEAMNISFHVYVTEDDFRVLLEEIRNDNWDQHPKILKIHGTIEFPDSIISKVEQQAKKEKPAFRIVFEELLSKEKLHLCYWGYSFRDLRFDINYLGQVKAAENGGQNHSICNFLPGEQPPSYITKLSKEVKKYGVNTHITHSLLETIDSLLDGHIDNFYKRRANDFSLYDALKSWADAEVSPAVASRILGQLLAHIGEKELAKDVFKMCALFSLQAAEHKNFAKALNNIGEMLYYAEGKKAVVYHETALQIQKSLNDKPGEAYSSNKLALVTNGINHPRANDFKKLYKRALHIYVALKDSEGQIDTMNYLALAKMDNSDFESALYYFEKALDIATKTGTRGKTAMLYHNIGLVYYRLKNFSETQKYYEQALSIEKELGHMHGIARVMDSMAGLLIAQAKYNRAICLLKKVLAMDEAMNNMAQVAFILRNIGRVYIQKNRILKGLGYLEHSLNLWKKFEQIDNVTLMLEEIAKVQYRRKKYKQALLYIEEVLEIQRYAGNQNVLRRIENARDEILQLIEERYRVVVVLFVIATIVVMSLLFGK